MSSGADRFGYNVIEKDVEFPAFAESRAVGDCPCLFFTALCSNVSLVGYPKRHGLASVCWKVLVKLNESPATFSFADFQQLTPFQVEVF